MRRFTYLSALIIAIMTFLPPVGTAQAQSMGEGLMNALSYKSLPANAVFSVRPLDNSDQNLRLKQEFENALRAKGYGVSDDAALVINFETRDEIGSYSTRNKRSVLELQARGGREGGEDAKMRFNLYDSNSGGMLNTGKGETTIQSPSEYRLDVSIDDKSTGKRHWQAWTVAGLDRSDSTALYIGMIPEMVANMGERVKSHVFELR